MLIMPCRALFFRTHHAALGRRLGIFSTSSSYSSKGSGSLTESIRVEAEAEMSKLLSHYKGQTKAPILWTSQDEAASYVKEHIDTVLFDCDGVLYRTPDPIPGSRRCIEKLIATKKVLFVTNNAGVNRQQLRDKLSKVLDIDGLLTVDQMISSSYSAGQYLTQQLANKEMSGKRVHVIGSRGLCEELDNFGFEISGGPSSDSAEMDRQELANYEFQESPIDAIVVGHDIAFTFRKLSIANVLLQKNPNAILIATNRDSFDLVGEDGHHIPGNGAIVAALEYSSGRIAVNTGKRRAMCVLSQLHHDQASHTCLCFQNQRETKQNSIRCNTPRARY